MINSQRGPRIRPTWEKAARKMIKLLIISSRRFVGVLIPIVHFLDAVYDDREGWRRERNNNSHTAVSPLLRSALDEYEVFRRKDYNRRLGFSPIGSRAPTFASVTSKSLSDGAEWASINSTGRAASLMLGRAMDEADISFMLPKSPSLSSLGSFLP